MNHNNHSVGLAWWRVAVVYLMAGVALGIAMGISGNHALFGVHAHINLLGWASLALIGLIYQQLPALGRNRLANIQFWMHNIGLPVMMLGLTGRLLGHEAFAPALGVGALIVGVAVALFGINLLFVSRGPLTRT